MAADSDDPHSPLGKEARALSDQAWSRARAHELTEEQLQEIIGQLRELAGREPDEFEREGIEAEIYVLRDLFQLVEYQERDAAMAPVRGSDLVVRAHDLAARAPIAQPAAESPQQRAERRTQIDEALHAVGQLYRSGTAEQQAVLQEYLDTLRWARDAIDGYPDPT
jgi:hypothetical protein